jgi:hypothetical protein
MTDIPQFMRDLAEEWERTDPERIDQAIADYAPDAYFRDPFNEFHGVNKIREVLVDMYDMLDDVSFTIHGISAEQRDESKDRQHIHFRWTMSYGDLSNPVEIPGMSDFVIDPDKQIITRHVDYWDSGHYLYRRIPILGWFIRLIQKKLAVT